MLLLGVNCQYWTISMNYLNYCVVGDFVFNSNYIFFSLGFLSGAFNRSVYAARAYISSYPDLFKHIYTHLIFNYAICECFWYSRTCMRYAFIMGFTFGFPCERAPSCCPQEWNYAGNSFTHGFIRDSLGVCGVVCVCTVYYVVQTI